MNPGWIRMSLTDMETPLILCECLNSGGKSYLFFILFFLTYSKIINTAIQKYSVTSTCLELSKSTKLLVSQCT